MTVTIGKSRILVIDDQEARYQAIRLALPDIGIDLSLQQIADREALHASLKQAKPALILCAPDSRSLGISEVREVLAEHCLEAPLIAFGDLVKADSIVSLVSLGADDVADMNRSEHLALVSALHLGAIDKLRERWQLRERNKASAPWTDKDSDRRSSERESPEVWRQRLVQAVKDQQFSLSRQKISSLDSGEKDSGREHIDILLRLDMEQNDGPAKLPAGRFLEQARLAGLTAVIDGWVVHQVCAQLGKLNADGLEPLFFVRIEPDTLENAQVGHFVEKFVTQHKCKADGLSFEIPQAAFRALENQGLDQLRALRKFGCLLTHSHCDIGDPSTDWPDGLQPDYVKLNSTALRQLVNQENAVDILQSAVQKLHAHDVQVIAPQVEQANALAVIWSSGVDYAQGFYQSHPEVVISS